MSLDLYDGQCSGRITGYFYFPLIIGLILNGYYRAQIDITTDRQPDRLRLFVKVKPEAYPYRRNENRSKGPGGHRRKTSGRSFSLSYLGGRHSSTGPI